VRQADGLLHHVALQVAAAHQEMRVDAGEDFRVRSRALRLETDLAAGDVLAAFFQDHDHVVGRAAARPGEHGLHRARREIAAAAVGSAVHRQDVVAAGFGDERHPGAGPADRAFHGAKPPD